MVLENVENKVNKAYHTLSTDDESQPEEDETTSLLNRSVEENKIVQTNYLPERF